MTQTGFADVRYSDVQASKASRCSGDFLLARSTLDSIDVQVDDDDARRAAQGQLDAPPLEAPLLEPDMVEPQAFDAAAAELPMIQAAAALEQLVPVAGPLPPVHVAAADNMPLEVEDPVTPQADLYNSVDMLAEMFFIIARRCCICLGISSICVCHHIANAQTLCLD